MKVVTVTHSTGFKAPFAQELTEENRRKIIANGGLILTTIIYSVGLAVRCLKQFNSYEIGIIIANTLRMIGAGDEGGN